MNYDNIFMWAIKNSQKEVVNFMIKNKVVNLEEYEICNSFVIMDTSYLGNPYTFFLVYRGPLTQAYINLKNDQLAFISEIFPTRRLPLG